MKSRLYTPSQIVKMTESEIRKAYSELRSIANKRIMRLEQQNLRSDYNRFATIAQINESSKWDVGSQLAMVSKFLSSKRTTVRGQKAFLREFREDMISRGYGDLVKTNDDVYAMIDFMEQMRQLYSDKLFDSGDALDVLQQTERLNVPKEKVIKYYDLFANNLDKLESVKPSKQGKEFSQARIRTLIKKWE